MNQSGLKQSDIDKHLGTQMSGHYFGKSQWGFPTQKEYEKMREIMPALKPYGEVKGYHDLCETVKRLESVKSLENLQSLESLQNLESVKSFENLENLGTLRTLHTINTSYENVSISGNSVIYCDIPYKGSTQYDKKEVGAFNHDEFYEWVRVNSNKYDIYISEYKENVPDDFSIVWECNSKKDIRNSQNERVGTVEVLIKYF